MANYILYFCLIAANFALIHLSHSAKSNHFDLTIIDENGEKYLQKTRQDL